MKTEVRKEEGKALKVKFQVKQDRERKKQTKKASTKLPEMDGKGSIELYRIGISSIFDHHGPYFHLSQSPGRLLLSHLEKPDAYWENA